MAAPKPAAKMAAPKTATLPADAPVCPPPSAPAKPKKPPEDGTRETIESVVVAFILAFLFRSFEAEAFVIPTGSMAPTLYGQHRDIVCKQCGVRYASGASDEMREGYANESLRTHTAICPNCRYPNFVYYDEVFTGDRILVTKYPYDFGDPQPWDVVVFKFPEEPKTNYIKRLVGLPGQELTFESGDVFVRPLGSAKPWQILRKPPDKQRDLQMLVYDDDHPPRDLLNAGWSERWQPDEKSGWTRTQDPNARSLRVDPDPAQAQALQWLRYRHVVPDTEAWEKVRTGKKVVNPPAPLLISDFCGYNARITVSNARAEAMPRGAWPAENDPFPTLPKDENGLLWVGDLTVNCQVDVLSDTGEIVWELVEGSRSYQAQVDVSTGHVLFSYWLYDSDGSPPEEIKLGQHSESKLKGRGTYQVSFANVDDRLCFWVNGELVKSFEFNPEAQDGKLSPVRPVRPTARDLAPAGIAAKNASVLVSHLKLERDVFYRPVSEQGAPDNSDPPFAFIQLKDEDSVRDLEQRPEFKGLFPFRTGDELAEVNRVDRLPFTRQGDAILRATLADPEQWNTTFDKFLRDRNRVFPLTDSANDADDEFLVLGDNSPRSSDSRYWSRLGFLEHRHAVPRSLLIGKAFFIYWPHAVPFTNGGRGNPVMFFRQPERHRGQESPPGIPSLSLPSYPQFGRMSRIR